MQNFGRNSEYSFFYRKFKENLGIDCIKLFISRNVGGLQSLYFLYLLPTLCGSTMHKLCCVCAIVTEKSVCNEFVTSMHNSVFSNQNLTESLTTTQIINMNK